MGLCVLQFKTAPWPETDIAWKSSYFLFSCTCILELDFFFLFQISIVLRAQLIHLLFFSSILKSWYFLDRILLPETGLQLLLLEV